MLPSFLVPEQVINASGSGAPVELGAGAGGVLSLTLGIQSALEQQSLDVTIWGSADGAAFGDKPLAAFPQKFYCGASSVLLDLRATPEITHLRADWKVKRWGRGAPAPAFGFYVFAEPAAVSLPAEPVTAG
jgi:hypothetical protein